MDCQPAQNAFFLAAAETGAPTLRTTWPCGERAARFATPASSRWSPFSRGSGRRRSSRSRGNGARAGEPSGRGLAGTGPGAVTEQSGAADMNLPDGRSRAGRPGAGANSGARQERFLW